MQLIYLPFHALFNSFDNISIIRFVFQRRLYEYALHAVCSPLRVIEPGITSNQLAAYVAKV
jgi:hypothetical protein